MASAVVERDPAYKTWEDERAALLMRRAELESKIMQFVVPDADELFETLVGQGYSEDYCHDAAEKTVAQKEAELIALKSVLRTVSARLAIIKPLASEERHAKQGPGVRQRRHDQSQRANNEYQAGLFSYLERIATALEAIAGCKAVHKKNGRKRRATA